MSLTGAPEAHLPSSVLDEEIEEYGLPASEYAVGYGKPPVEHRFQKGRSGNPYGRPRKTRDFDKLFEETLLTSTKVRTDAGLRTMTVYEMMLLSVVQQAAKGDARATKAILDKVDRITAAKAERAKSAAALSLGVRMGDPAAMLAIGQFGCSDIL